MCEIEIFLRMAFLGLAAIMLLLTIISLSKVRELKLALATVGFGIFAAEGALMVAGVFAEKAEGYVGTMLLAGMNFAALAFLYLSVVKR